MLRRNVRLRREYLYRKSLEGNERALYEKKRKIREALQEGKPIPTELRNEEAALRRQIDLEDENTAVPTTHIDDEYAFAAEKDPKIMLTTSRDPSAPLQQFVKELSTVFPNAQRINRGGQVISEIIDACRSHDYTDVILVHENRGVPAGLTVYHLPFGPTACFSVVNVLGERTSNILKHLFPVPKPEAKRIVSFSNNSDYIEFRHHIYQKRADPNSIELKEIGPRFNLRLYQIKLGTVDHDEGQTEWVFRPYMNTTKRREFL
ncbi:uncharacterized protein LOC127135089 isoform X2 [Lathyrus oleraceus]|uniref:uncharacterized protein LOC127135089 isoform X2 n=1 Tax=Pisum sativum TaxID=3888 RepID=UPI0021D0332D|nr:uncharacterized protein LOC127135089 isoform X2 [Pisum sativum]